VETTSAQRLWSFETTRDSWSETKMENTDGHVCPKCGGTKIFIDTEAGEEVCSQCGLVITNDVVDPGAEWRAFEFSEYGRSRAGQALTPSLWDGGMSTSFNCLRDGTGKPLKLGEIDKMYRLKKYDNRSKINDTQARNLSIAMSELSRLTSAIHISETTRNNAALLYRKALNKDMIRGRSIDSFVAACVYAACRMQGIPRSLKAIAVESHRELGDVARTYRLLVTDLGLKMPLNGSEKFIPSISARLRLNRATEQHAVEILREAKNLQKLSGKDPRGLAAAALYLSCVRNQERRTQKEVASAAGTTEVTLRNRVKGLEDILRVPPEYNSPPMDVTPPIPTGGK
jgi:transcription initiation factor TFIIB